MPQPLVFNELFHTPKVQSSSSSTHFKIFVDYGLVFLIGSKQFPFLQGLDCQFQHEELHR